MKLILGASGIRETLCNIGLTKSISKDFKKEFSNMEWGDYVEE